MEKQMILKNVLQQMRAVDSKGNPIPFNVEVRTWNKQNKMGGKLKIYNQAILCFHQEKKVKDWEKYLQVKHEEKARKNPNHFEHYTRNIELPTGEVKKINILLITKFNGIEVVY